MSNTPKSNGRAPAGGQSAFARPTVSHMLGEIVWLLTQSPLHRQFRLADLEWLIMPALLHEQYYVFRDGDKPVGVALWARVTPEAERKLEGGIVKPENRLTPAEWTNGETIWLIDLIAPFANPQNRHVEVMMADLVSGPLKGKAFKLHRTDAKTGKRSVVTVEADAGDRLKSAVEQAVADQGGEGNGPGKEA